jgi:hypothetical protein
MARLYTFSTTHGVARFTLPFDINNSAAFADELETSLPGLRVCSNEYGTRLRKSHATAGLPAGTLLFLSAPIELFDTFRTKYPNFKAALGEPTIKALYGQSNSIDETLFNTIRNDENKLQTIGAEIVGPVSGLLKPQVALFPYQYTTIGLSHISNSLLAVIPPGGGKTRTALIAAFARIQSHAQEFNIPLYNYSVLIVGPDITENSWLIQPAELTPVAHHLAYFRGKKTMRTFSFKPVSERRKSDPSFAAYRVHCRQANIPMVAFCNTESMPALFGEITKYDCIPTPSVIIFDELHTMSSRERYAISYAPDGSVVIDSKMTSSAKQETRASVLSELSKIDNVLLRIGLSATPLTEGTHRRIWAQVDLLNPYAFGNYFAFRREFTAAAPDAFKPEVDDSASINAPVLRARLHRFLMQIPASVVDAFMPPIRYQAEWVNYTGKDPRRIALDKSEPSESPLEMRLAQACQIKAPDIAQTVVETLATNPNAKVLIFVGRRAQTGLFAEALRTKMTRRWQGDNKPPWPKPELVCRNGDNTALERTEAIEQFRQPGQRVLIATYQFMGMSLDGLQVATNLEVAMLPSQPGIWDQMRGRIKRLGGVPCLVRIWFARGTYDERLYATFLARAKATAETLDVAGAEIAEIASLMADPELSSRILSDANIDFSAWGSADDDE